jgi:hypothetical protein
VSFIALRKNGQPDEQQDRLDNYSGMHGMTYLDTALATPIASSLAARRGRWARRLLGHGVELDSRALYCIQQFTTR